MTARRPGQSGDPDLLDAAIRLLATRYVPGRHAVAAALRFADGDVHVGLHLGAGVASAAVCAEAVALGAARTAGVEAFSTLVTVHHALAASGWRVVAPCGTCRELLCHHAPGLKILVPDDVGGDASGIRPAQIETLLPDRFTRD